VLRRIRAHTRWFVIEELRELRKEERHNMYRLQNIIRVSNRRHYRLCLGKVCSMGFVDEHAVDAIPSLVLY
jgi:hypothetical protein